MERGRLHEWTKVEFKAICRKHDLSVSGGKGELMEHVRVHFQLYCPNSTSWLSSTTSCKEVVSGSSPARVARRSLSWRPTLSAAGRSLCDTHRLQIRGFALVSVDSSLCACHSVGTPVTVMSKTGLVMDVLTRCWQVSFLPQGALPEVVPAVGSLFSAVPPAMEHSGGRTLHHCI